MTETRNDPTSERLSLSTTQIVASVLAAVSATTAASFFGVAGTVIGAALGSAITVIGSAVYSFSIRRTRHRVRQGLDLAVARRFGTDSPEAGQAGTDWSSATEHSARPVPRPKLPGFRPRQLAVGAGALFVVTLGLVTGFELLSGQPLTATVHGASGSGLSIDGGATSKHSASPSTSPSTPTSTAVSSSTPRTSASSSTTGSTSASTPSSATSASPSASASTSTSAAGSTTAGSSTPSTTSSESAGGHSATPAPSATPAG